MTLEAEGPTPGAQPHDEAAALRQVKSELSVKIERECAHVDAVLSERIDGVRELLDQRINDQTRLLKAEFNGLEAKLAHETGALRTEIGSVADKMETSLAHETEKLRTEIGGLEERIEAKLCHETGTLRAEIAGQKEQIDTRLAHDFGAVGREFEAVGREFEAVRKEFKAVRAEIAGLKELLLGRMEQQEKVRAAEYAATKWSIRSLMAAMALLVAMMARFTLFQ
ncbi:MAG: hypothetical protein F4112_13560 [Holophagales bacterium]|nr:hypothetical protein [Holophagales bacterium]MYD20699.1 hypothetical protein [Holophagales bacterium]MYI33979.1 hypothetical protein [Holophagales bacterium]